MQFLDKLGWPVVRIKGRPIVNLIRLLLHTRKVELGTFTHDVGPSDQNVGTGP